MLRFALFTVAMGLVWQLNAFWKKNGEPNWARYLKWIVLVLAILLFGYVTYYTIEYS